MIFVVGHINLETTLRVDGFPIPYGPVHYPFFGVRSTPSGVGLNWARALTTLGHTVRFVTMLGRDPVGDLILGWLEANGLPTQHVQRDLAESAQAVILYDGEGRRQIHLDLKNAQEMRIAPELLAQAAAGCELALVGNINYARAFLAQSADLRLPVACDVHTIGAIDDPYNSDFMAAATILFQSDEKLPCPPEAWIGRLQQRYNTPIAVVGMGAQGALLGVRGEPVRHVPAVRIRPIVNTIGAGDALLSAFVHGMVRHGDPLRALQQAVVFAGYKIGERGAAEGFLTADELAALDPQG
jgi:ribokinase